MAGKTLYDKLWDAHEVRRNDDGTSILYIDRHLLHEVTSAQAFDGLEASDRKLWRIDANLAVSDHNVPTTDRSAGISDPISKLQVDTLDANCDKHNIVQFKMDDPRQGIVHVIGPEQGATLPGMTVVCGDSHTSTHGAFACLAQGIGTSEVEHVLATQCLMQKKSKNMRIVVNGRLGPGVSAKDLILGIIGKIGIAGGTGYAIEYTGEVISALSMEGRMTVCNMSVEAGARAGMVAVDDKTIEYLKGRPFAPKGEMWDKAVAAWWNLVSDHDAVFDHEVVIDAAAIVPHVSWGTSPEMVIGIDERIPNPQAEDDPFRREGMERALQYMGLEADVSMTDVMVDKIFIGSCTNGRIDDLRAAAHIVRGHKLADNIKLAMVVPGSGLVKRQAEEEGIDKDFIEAGFEWREPGCSMCLAMNDDRLDPEERCASTSNRNFEGRQGHLSRTHLVGPEMAAACAIAGHFVDVRDWPD
ncbi:MAG: 3-isopropylmalate dehydratase large subunit [Gammaproteobacteria bacterium]|nr:MAG: 3-isopropylmalate dehydratase large subunit [Gammaproteobacteria bacterium]